MEYLRKKDFVTINRVTIERHGGNFVPPENFLNEEPLDYLIEAVEARMFGQEIYAEVYQKAGLYMFSVISNHIFQDGNKRTGLEAALVFLQLNNYQLKDIIEYQSKNSAIEVLIDFTFDIAKGELSLEDCQNWLKSNIEHKK